ncbi:hypothetical protein DL96DRAFT_1810741 [Flagelloscypha sp. PMI_526]|nr:hypothetical protein DL96DRAFT_1810741 [Flagelloscypha sp. PMI_526]
MPVSVPSSPSDGVRLLSFDGGGIHSITQALMVREMMHRVEEGHQLLQPPKVSNYFDMICGSGLGGLLAVMCSVFHMTSDQLVEEYINMCKVLFSEDLGTAQRTIKLDQEIKRLAVTYIPGGEERKMISLGYTCKTFVCAASSQNPSHPRLFRNYRSPTYPSPDCTIREAVRATVALSRLFNPIVIRDKHLSERFDGGELKWNNPTDELTKEAAREFQSHHVATIVSIGSGHQSHLSLAEGLADLFPIIALDCERLSEDIERRFGNTPDVYWRLSGQHGLQNLAIGLFNIDALVSHTSSCLQDACTQREISSLPLALVLRPRRILAKMISRRGSSTAKVVGPRVCPLPSEYFTGRYGSLKELEEYFNSRSDKCHVAVLYGMGGTGKTEMGLQFVHQNQSRIYFIDASSQLSLETDLIAIASETPGQPSVDDALRTLRNRQDEWLLFFDNADDLSLNLQPYLSWSHGNILITTRHWELCVHAPKCSISVEHLELEDAKELLLRGLPVTDDPKEQETAARIVQELSCSALAVSQTRTFLAKGLCSLSGYLPIYVQNRKKLIECKFIQRSGDSPSSEHATWEISFKQLSLNAALLLKFLSFMHHDNIPSRLFQDAWEVYADQDEDAVPPILIKFLSSFTAVNSTWDALHFRTLVGELLSFSLLGFDQVRNTFSLHPLVQQWARGYSQHFRDNAHATQTLLSLASPIGDSVLDIVRKKSLLPHLRESVMVGITSHYTLLSRMGHVFRRGGSLDISFDVYQEALKESQLIFGASNPETLYSMHNLALAYSDLGQHRNALELNEQVLKLRKQILGEEHPDTLRILKLQKLILGGEHPETLRSMHNLGIIYSDLGQHRRALEMKEQVLKLRRQILGDEHPDTIGSMHNLARTYSNLGQHRNALELNEQVLQLRKRILGEEHPNTLSSMSNLALTYSDLGQHRNALELKKRILKLRTHVLGEEHPDTLKSMTNLARTFSDLGKHDNALQLNRQVLKLRKQILGQEHTDTIGSMYSLALTYSAIGEHRNAIELNEHVLRLQTQILGEEHPHTLRTIHTLAFTYSDLGQHGNALELKNRILKLHTQVFGEEHPNTLRSMLNLAVTYSALGRHLNALELNEEVLKLQKRILGEEHLDTLGSMHNLANTNLILGRHRQALDLHEQTLEARKRILGEEHPDTRNSLQKVETARSLVLRDARTLKKGSSKTVECSKVEDGSALGERKGGRKRDKLKNLLAMT